MSSRQEDDTKIEHSCSFHSLDGFSKIIQDQQMMITFGKQNPFSCFVSSFDHNQFSCSTVTQQPMQIYHRPYGRMLSYYLTTTLPSMACQMGGSYMYPIVTWMTPATNSTQIISIQTGPTWLTVTNTTLYFSPPSTLVKSSYPVKVYFYDGDAS